MQIVILGGGAVGTSLAQMLSREGHDVTVVDAEQARLAKIGETVDVR
ncbi:MAG: FAD-dependent oxidoreductase, partial [bacterium]